MFSKKYIILYLILLFLLARLYLLFSGLENLMAPYPETEEKYRGTIAKMFMDGYINSLLDFQHNDYNGISTVQSLASIPFFYVFGPYFFSLKLGTLTFLLITMVLWFFFIKRHVSIGTAVITALLFIFAPPSFVFFNLSSDFHGVALFFDILAITFFFEMIHNTPLNPLLIEGKRHISNISPLKRGGMGVCLPYAQVERASTWWYALFGLASGFAIWVDNVSAITLITCIVFWFIYDKRFFFKRTFAFFVIGFFAGFSIWFYYVVCIRHFQIMDIFEYSSYYQKPIFYKKFWETLAYNLPYSFCFKDYFFSGIFLNYLYYVIFATAFVGLIWLQRKQILRMLSSFLPSRLQGGRGTLQRAPTVGQSNQTIMVESFFLGYIVIFILTFSLSRFDVGFKSGSPWHYRFFPPLYPFIFVTIAIGLNKLLNIRGILLKIISCILLFIIVSVGIMELLSQTKLRDFGKGLTFNGYSYKSLQLLVFRHDLSKVVKIANQIDDGLYKNYLYERYGFKLALVDKLEPSACESLIRNVEEAFRLNCYEGVGYGYGVRYRYSSDVPIMFEKLKTTNLKNKDYEKYLFYGVATALSIQQTVDKHIFMISQIDSQFQPYFYQGLGIQLARGMGLADVNGILLEIDPTNKKYCCIGIGQDLARRLEWAFADKKYYIGFDGLNKDYWRDCYYGLGWGIGDFFEFDMDRYLAVINNNASPEYMEYCFKGLADRLRWKFGDDAKKFQKVTEQFPE